MRCQSSSSTLSREVIATSRYRTSVTPCSPATIHRKVNACDVRCRIGQQELDRASYFIRKSNASHRHLMDQTSIKTGIVALDCQRWKRTRTHGIYADVIMSQMARQISCELDQTCLSSAIERRIIIRGVLVDTRIRAHHAIH